MSFARTYRTNSVSCIEDLETNKRKREEETEARRQLEEGLALFRMSNKVSRSPETTKVQSEHKVHKKKEEPEEQAKNKEKEKEEEKMEEVKEMFKSLTVNIQEMKTDLKAQIQDLKEKFEAKEAEWQEEKKILHSKITELEDRMEQEDRYKRKNNIIMRGKDMEVLKEEDIQKFLNDTLEIEIKTEEQYRLGGKTAGILIKCKNWSEKEKIMKNKSKLKIKGKEIFIDNDLTRQEREIQKKIREMAAEERNKGKRVKIAYQKLIIDGRIYKWLQRENKMEEMILNKDSAKNEENVKSQRKGK